MAKPGRKPRPIPAVRKNMYLSQDVVAQVELLLTDPNRQRYNIKFGAWSGLIDELLRKWVQEQQNPQALPKEAPVEGQYIPADASPLEAMLIGRQVTVKVEVPECECPGDQGSCAELPNCRFKRRAEIQVK